MHGKESIAAEHRRAIVGDISNHMAEQPDRVEVTICILQLTRFDPNQFALTVFTVGAIAVAVNTPSHQAPREAPAEILQFIQILCEAMA